MSDYLVFWMRHNALPSVDLSPEVVLPEWRNERRARIHNLRKKKQARKAARRQQP